MELESGRTVDWISMANIRRPLFFEVGSGPFCCKAWTYRPEPSCLPVHLSSKCPRILKDPKKHHRRDHHSLCVGRSIDFYATRAIGDLTFLIARKGDHGVKRRRIIDLGILSSSKVAKRRMRNMSETRTKTTITGESLKLSKEQRSRQREAQIAFNNSPEAKQIDKEFLESLRHEQQLEEGMREKHGLK